MARPMVCTPAAAEGLQASTLLGDATAENPAALAGKVIASLHTGEGPAHRDYVIANYGWEANLAVVDRLLSARGATRAHEPLVAVEQA